MTYRNRFHSSIESFINHLLWQWLEQQPEPRGRIVSGEAGFRLQGTKPSIVGIDVAYVSHEQLVATKPSHKLFEGPPVLAVEVLSGTETHEEVAAKINLYLEFGVVVWVVDLYLRTVSVHREGQAPQTFNTTQELDGEPELPCFQVPVSRLFSL